LSILLVNVEPGGANIIPGQVVSGFQDGDGADGGYPLNAEAVLCQRYFTIVARGLAIGNNFPSPVRSNGGGDLDGM